VTPERWRQINELFHAALERDRSTREAFLREATRGDEELLREVRSLLAKHFKSGEFLEQPAWGVAADLILDDPPSATLVGKCVGKYHVLEEVGRGGMGIVYAAEDEDLRRMVALKALTPEYISDPTRRERLKREAQAAAALLHPAIATIFAFEEIEGNVYIVSELVRGRTLRDELRDGPLPPAQLQPVLIALAEALAAAHQRGIVHRDLKPENIIRRDDGQIKVLDFGIARSPVAASPTATKLTQAGTALGTPGYMAPEQFSGTDVDGRTDQFAFGVVAWELATGEHPFGADAASVLAIMTDLMQGKTVGLSRALPLPGLERIVRRCVRAAPAERYPSAEALLADLRALDTRSAPARPVPEGDSLWWWQFHQVAIAVVNALMPVAMWTIRHWVPSRRPYASTLFLAALTFATVSVTLRLNLFFTSRVHPAMLVEQRTRSFPGIAFADAALAMLLLAGAALIAGDHDEYAALFLSLAIVDLASLGFIEPATTRAAGLKAPKGARGA
jgi:serine/threonine protein kinase